MDLDNISDEQYKLLYNRIKTDLYNEFINPEQLLTDLMSYDNRKLKKIYTQV